MARPIRKKQAIEDAALELFARHGLNNVSVKEIAAAAGVTEGALYRHYLGKNELAKALFVREVERFATALTVALRGDCDWREQLRKAVRFIYDYYAANPIGYAFVILHYHDFREDNLVGKEHNPSDIVIQSLGGMVGQDGERLVLQAGMLMGAVTQPVILHYYGRLPESPLVYADEVGRRVIQMLEPQA